MTGLPTTANRTAALGAQERRPCTVLELTVDRCANVYHTAPCTANAGTGNECYNTFETCQDKTHYIKTTQTLQFVSRGVVSPPGQSLRPYLLGSVSAPANLDFEAGLAARNNVSVSLANETDNDSSQDPYFATRATPAGGTFWARWLARNKNYFGRSAKLRKGFVADPWDWTLFLDELYIIDSMAFDNNGQVKIVLKDPLKLTDNNTIPLPTSGAIQADLKNVENTGVAQAGGSNTITLASAASAVDGYYVGMEVYVYANTGAGQRRVVSSYVGATRVATLATAWAANPDNTSAYQVSGLSVTVDSGKGAQYTVQMLSNTDHGTGVTVSRNVITYASAAGSVRAMYAASSGKYYFEVVVGAGTVGSFQLGIATSAADMNANPLSASPYAWVYTYGGGIANNNANVQTGSGFVAGDIIGVAVDATSLLVTFYKNGVQQGVPQAIGAGPWYPVVDVHAAGSNGLAVFDAASLKYIPAGYQPWESKFVRIDSEIIAYTAITGDVLSWPSATYRAQFGSARGDHSASASVQLCRAYINQPIASVLTALLTESGIPAGYIGASLASETGIWYGTAYNITACISAPEQASVMLGEILQQIGAVMWWSPHTQSIEFKAIMPSAAAYPTWDDASTIMQGSMSVKNLDALRITEYATSYALRDATANLSEPRSFMRTDVVINSAAESINEYGDVRPKITTSRWFGLSNAGAMLAVASRQINRLYSAPKLFTFKIDPKDYTQPIGALIGVQSYKNTDYSGNPKNELCIITQMNDATTHIEVQARSANFASRYAFIAPAGTADYPTEQVYAHIASSGGLMGDGSGGYNII